MPDHDQTRTSRALLLYHYMHPDDVVSAVEYDGLAEGLRERGWAVEAMPCTRGCRDESRCYPKHETWNGIQFRRIWRPAFRQASFCGRLLNSAWMILAWSLIGLRGRARRPDVVILGTDPMFGALAAVGIRFFSRTIRIVHWCFDLHPECAIAEKTVAASGLPARLARWAMRKAYACCDRIVDIGPCMRERLRAYGHGAAEETIHPWALVEPPAPLKADPATRRELFGDAALGLFYSGSFGRGHLYEPFLDLARRLRGDGVGLCFAVRGNCADTVRQAVGAEDANVRFAGFAAAEELPKRLGAADIHLASLAPEWTGLVLPSKFFGSLAAGRPVLFAGSPDCSLARWIVEHDVGWVLQEDNAETVAERLRVLATDPGELHEIQQRCHRVYREHFACERMLDKWDAALRELLSSSFSEGERA